MSNLSVLKCKLVGHKWLRLAQEDTHSKLCYVCNCCGVKQTVKKAGYR